ncbi:MAG: cytochrome c oxidase subunit 3 [Terriglobales bacterium]|jgi:cytochrome c oxidase subunit 3/cytochrome o ubiquinol oxidase subunit 3
MDGSAINTSSITLVDPVPEWKLPSRGRVGMFGLIAAESAVFTIFVVAYLFYLGKSISGPLPKDVLSVPIFYTICLLSSSLTIHFAVAALRSNKVRAFSAWWFATIALGAIFLFGTGVEWHRLIYHEGLTISTNLFGTTYYSLVGLHAFHVVVGLLSLSLVMAFALFGWVRQDHAERIDVLSLYWHFVDSVWVVVFTVVYIIGR